MQSHTLLPEDSHPCKFQDLLRLSSRPDVDLPELTTILYSPLLYYVRHAMNRKKNTLPVTKIIQVSP